jgi:hypothetical protein
MKRHNAPVDVKEDTVSPRVAPQLNFWIPGGPQSETL